MATVKRLLALLLLSSGAALLQGCAGTESENPDRVSTIPWNRPEKWEGQGPLGGFSPNQY